MSYKSRQGKSRHRNVCWPTFRTTVQPAEPPLVAATDRRRPEVLVLLVKENTGVDLAE